MTAPTKLCEHCLTPLEYDLGDRVMAFTAHTPEFCRDLTLYRIKTLDAMIKQHVLQEAAAHHEVQRLARELYDLRDSLQPKPVNEEDLQVHAWPRTTGGQHVGTSGGAILVVHKPTGIAFLSENERSQLRNKEYAMKQILLLLGKS